MTWTATLLWVANLFFDTVGQLSFKASATSAEEASGLARWKKMLTNVWIWVGVSAYVMEFLFWLAFLSVVPLSQAVLLGSVNILAVMIGGRIFFGEKLTLRRTAAALLIATGVALVGWG
ncbi:MAG TPA: EamA family transporter [Candidatus Manganitrophaceae bacterium]|nr:EamA family transporter [Candidatus Manganitrophaceae bacterium]